MTLPNFEIEDSTHGIVAGVDEAGRGPWAGPVVAAAIIANRNNFPTGINDSKKLTPAKREFLFEHITQTCTIGVGIATVEEIDNLNILQATMLAMQRAILLLPLTPDIALIDGNKTPKLSCKSLAIVKGDTKSLSIAAASIIAKVTRDRIMCKLAKEQPFYGWEKNSGYGTKMHQNGLLEYGISLHHRKSFKPIRDNLYSKNR